MATETYRSIHTGAEIDAAVTFAKNPDSAPAIGSQVAVTSDGVAVALRNAASDTDEAIAAEAAARQAAITAEANARQAANTTLQNNINAEAATRQTQINSVSDLIGHVSDRLNAEAAAREQADNALGTEIGHKQDILTFDDTPRQNSSNPVKSSGIWQKNRELYSEMQGGDANILSELHENYARVDGAYETLTAGNAEQLLSTQYVEDSVPYIFRPSGNHADIGDREFDTLVGGSIVWNQLMPTFSAVTTGTSQQQFIQVAGQNDVFTVGHKYFVRVDVTSLSDYADCRMRYPSPRYLFTGKNQFIVDAINANFVIELESADGSDVQLALPANYAMACDLTLMFGSAVADYIYNLELAGTSAGVAYLLNLIPLLGGDYMAQNAGTMLSVNASAHETVGFNQWDEEWELGGINWTTGEPVSATNRIRSKNYCRCLPNTDYYVNYPASSGAEEPPMNILWYDSNKGYIRRVNRNNDVITSPPNAHYFKIVNTAVTSYNNDICINLSWNGTRNGEYEPYEKRTYLLTEGELYPATTLRGVPVVENSKVKYDGDIYNPDGTVERRYEVSDLGAFTWTIYNTSVPGSFYTGGIKHMAAYEKFAISTLGWTAAQGWSAWVNGPDKSYHKDSNGNFYVKDSAYQGKTSAEFKALMSGQELVYKTNTPTTESATPYQSPQIVDDWGTERYVDYEYSIGQRPIPVPVGHNTKYPANLRDKVQHLPSLADSDGTYAIQQAGTQMSLVPLPVVIPEPPSANGTYTLKATVSGGAATLTWGV